MVTGRTRIVWTKVAQGQLRQAFDRISEDSPKNALKVVSEITGLVEKAAEHPDSHPPVSCNSKMTVRIERLKGTATAFLVAMPQAFYAYCV